jgi:uncharacterized membrane protein YcfT
MTGYAGTLRVDWVDYAKGFCIVFVVMMHSVLGVEHATGEQGWLNPLVVFAAPFRMPDFFLIAGLFLARVIDRDWRTYLDRKVFHFVYFYVLWVTIQFALRAPGYAAELGWQEVARLYALSFIEPFGTMWFIYLLPVFFVVTKLVRHVPPAVVWLIAACLEIAPIHTGWTVPDEFAARFVYFYTGYLLAPAIFSFAQKVQDQPATAVLGVAGWALLNGALVFAGVATFPLVSLALGLAGAAAVVAGSALMARVDLFAPLRYAGEHSLVVYLAFVLFMAPARIVLIKAGLIDDVGTMSAIVTAVAVIGPLALSWLVRNTPLRFLFERPQRLWLTPVRRPALQPAE